MFDLRKVWWAAADDHKNKKLYIQAGAGIVYDSVAENEWAETMNKGRAIFRAVALAESGLSPHDPCQLAQEEKS